MTVLIAARKYDKKHFCSFIVSDLISISSFSLETLIRVEMESLLAVRLREASQGGVVPSGVVEHESKVRGVGVLSRVGVVRGGAVFVL